MIPAAITGPKVLFTDIETAHNLLAAFQLYGNDYIPHGNIVQERFVICGAWQWLGESKIHSVSLLDDPKRFKKNHTDDFHVVQTLHGVMDEADVIVTHNGDAFDNKWVKGRALIHKLPPLSPFKSIDTLKIAKTQFKLNCNRLDYIGQVLGVGRKKETKPGLWLEVLRGEKKAIEEMVAYNKGDISLLKDVFTLLQPWMPEHFNREIYGGDRDGCPRCGAKHIQSRGVYRAISRTYQRWQCQNPDCMGWFRSDKTEKAARPRFRVL